MVKVSFSFDEKAQGSDACGGREERMSRVIERWRLGDDGVWESTDDQDVHGEENKSRDRDVWETESFNKRRKESWACFDYYFDDRFYDLPDKKFKKRVDPRSGIRGMLKPGYKWMYTLDLDCDRLEEGFVKGAENAARAAVDFYNKWKKGENVSIQFDKLVGKMHRCVGCSKGTHIFFVTFDAIDNTGAKKTFQASVLAATPDAAIFNTTAKKTPHVVIVRPVYRVRAFRPKP